MAGRIVNSGRCVGAVRNANGAVEGREFARSQITYQPVKWERSEAGQLARTCCDVVYYFLTMYLMYVIISM